MFKALTHLSTPLLSLNSVGGWVTAALVGGITNWWHAAPDLVQRLVPAALGLILADALSRGLVALSRREFDSEKVGRTLVKFFSYAIGLFVAVWIDSVTQAGYAAVIIVLSLIVYREGTSTLENLKELGLEFGPLKDILNGWRSNDGK